MTAPSGALVATERPPRAAALAVAGYVALFASGFADNARGPVLPSIVDTFRCPDSHASVLLGLASLAGLPGGLAAGALVARRGPRATLALVALLTAVGLALVAVAGALGEGFFALVPVASLFVGFGLAGLGVVSNFYVALSAAPHERARALARLHVLYAVASIGVPFLIAHATAAAPWPLVIGAAALVPGSLVLGSLLVPFVPPVTASGAAGSDASPTVPAPRAGATAAYATAISLFVVGEVSVSGWLTLLLKRTTDLGPSGRAGLLSGFFLGMLVSRGLAGAFLRESRIRAAILLGALATALLVLLGLHVSPLFLSLAGLPVGLLFPATMAALTLELPPTAHGRAIGIVTAAYSTVLGVSHTLVGKASDAWGIAPALHVSPVCLVLGAVVLWARRPIAKG